MEQVDRKFMCINVIDSAVTKHFFGFVLYIKTILSCFHKYFHFNNQITMYNLKTFLVKTE